MSKESDAFAAVQPLSAPVAVMGSANADLTVRVQAMPQAGETIHGGPLMTLPGGKSANQAVAAALLGAPTSFVGAVGNDDNGAFLLRSLADAGVNVDHVKRTDTPTSCAIITVDAHAENTIVVTRGANFDVDEALVAQAHPAVTEAKVLGLALEVPMEAVVAAAEMAHAAGVLVVFNPSPMPEQIPQRLLNAVDVLIVNEGEMRALIGHREEDWEGAEAALKALGVSRAIITLGPRGAMVLDSGATLVPVVSVPVVDTTGCGDSFTGAVLAALAAGADLVQASRFASIVASYASTGQGAQASYGTLDQIEQTILR